MEKTTQFESFVAEFDELCRKNKIPKIMMTMEEKHVDDSGIKYDFGNVYDTYVKKWIKKPVNPRLSLADNFDIFSPFAEKNE